MTTTVIQKEAAITLPGLGKLWKKKPVKLRNRELYKTAALNFAKKLWQGAGGSHFADKANKATSLADQFSKLKGPEGRAGQQRFTQDANFNNRIAKGMGGARNATAITAPVAATTWAAGGFDSPEASGTPAPATTPATTPAATSEATPATGYTQNARLQQRMDSPFGGLLDDFMNPESPDDASACTAHKAALGDKISLLQQWQLADPKIRYLLMALLMGGGLGAASMFGGNRNE